MTMQINWTKKTPESFDLIRSDGVVLARCINDRGTVVARVYNAMPSHLMRPVDREIFNYMEPAMIWCVQQLSPPGYVSA